jgi:hypothetical protein
VNLFKKKNLISPKIIFIFKVDLLQEGKNNSKRLIKPGMDLVNVKLALDNIYSLLTTVIDYVDKVLVIYLKFYHSTEKSLSLFKGWKN